jgi:hypothetical protein
MDEVTYGNLLRTLSVTIGAFGTLVGLDLIFGAKVIIVLKKILDRSTDIVDKAIINAQSKRLFGLVILFLSLVILFLGSRLKV